MTGPASSYAQILFIAQQLTAETTSFKNGAFFNRGLVPPHEADISKLVELDEELSRKYEPVKKEYYTRLEEAIFRSEGRLLPRGLPPGPKPTP